MCTRFSEFYWQLYNRKNRKDLKGRDLRSETQSMLNGLVHGQQTAAAVQRTDQAGFAIMPRRKAGQISTGAERARPVAISRVVLEKYFHMSLNQASKQLVISDQWSKVRIKYLNFLTGFMCDCSKKGLQVCIMCLVKVFPLNLCTYNRKLGIPKWPYRDRFVTQSSYPIESISVDLHPCTESELCSDVIEDASRSVSAASTSCQYSGEDCPDASKPPSALDASLLPFCDDYEVAVDLDCFKDSEEPDMLALLGFSRCTDNLDPKGRAPSPGAPRPKHATPAPASAPPEWEEGDVILSDSTTDASDCDDSPAPLLDWAGPGGPIRARPAVGGAGGARRWRSRVEAACEWVPSPRTSDSVESPLPPPQDDDAAPVCSSACTRMRRHAHTDIDR
jgi:hypothetical protein